MNILILGINGNLGRVIAPILEKKGHKVYGVSRSKVASKQIFTLDILKADEQSINNIFKMSLPNVVIHLVSSLEPTTLDEFKLSSISLLKMFNCNLARSAHHIIVGSAAEYGIHQKGMISPKKTFEYPVSNYGLSKILSTSLAVYFADMHNIRVTVVRLFNIFSPYCHSKSFIGTLINESRDTSKHVVNINSRLIQRDFLDLRDFGELINKISKSKGLSGYKIYNAASGINTNYGKIIKIFNKFLSVNKLKTIKIKEQLDNEAFSYSVVDISNTSKKFDWYPKIKLNESIDWCLSASGIINRI